MHNTLKIYENPPGASQNMSAMVTDDVTNTIYTQKQMYEIVSEVHSDIVILISFHFLLTK